MGLVFVADKLAVPKTLKEWVLQVAHGDHLGVKKMEELTVLVYWPGKATDIREKAKNCLVCFKAGKNLKTCFANQRK